MTERKTVGLEKPIPHTTYIKLSAVLVELLTGSGFENKRRIAGTS